MKNEQEPSFEWRASAVSASGLLPPQRDQAEQKSELMQLVLNVSSITFEITGGEKKSLNGLAEKE